MTGQPVTHELTDPVYWRRHLRNTVRFADGVATLHQQGVRLFVEIGPKATLLGLAQAVVEAALAQQAEGRQPQAALFLPSLREGQNDWQRLLLTLGELYVQGVAIDWPGLDQGYQRRKVTLPTYPFQRQRYWVETREKRQSAALRPLIDKMTYSPAIKERIFETPFSVAALPFLADHRVYGEVVSPGACQLAMVLSAAELTLGQRHAIHLHDLLLPQALVLPTASDQSGERTVQVILAPVAANGSGPHYDFKVISFTGDGNEAATTTATHATGSIVTTQPPAVSKRDLVGLRQQCATPFDLGAFYQTLNEQQIDLGARFRWLQTVWHSQAPASAPQEALAQLQCPVALQTSHGDLLHPGLLDACFQVAATLSVNASASAPLLPFALATLQLHRPATGHTWWCHAVAVGERKWDIQLTDEQGEAIATLTGFEMRPAAPHLIQRKELWRNWLYAQQWEAQPQVQTPQPTGQSRALSGQPWLIFADRQGIGAALSKGLQAQGAKTTLVYADETAVEAGQQTEAGNYQLHPQQIDHYRTLLATLAAEQTPLHVVHLWSLDTPGIEQFGEPSATTHLGCRATLSLVQALLAQPTLPASFWLVTAEAQAVQPADAVSGVTQAPLWGMGKVIALEYPDLACVRIDLDRAANDPAEITVRAEWLLQEITTQPEVNGRAEEIALRAGKRYVSRLVRYPQHAPEQTLPLPDGPYALTIRERGTLDQLQLTLLTRRPPAAHEVEIKVHTTGLNFLDVLETLGVSPYKRDAMGAECAGEVVAVGAAVTEYQIGDRVVALGDGSFQQYLTVATTRVVLRPKELSFMDAATIPVNFLTAYYALQVVTQLQPGDKVLIHAASGGTGMAAVKIAQSLGAEVYGTASPAKWGALQAIGVKHLYNSRTLDFAGEILRDTNGRGVNVVLNALTSAGFMEKSLSTLAPNGKFVEIAQRDVWTADQFKTTRPDVTYHLLNLRAILQQNPQQLQSLLVELLQQIKSGSLTLLPYQAFPLEQAITAFRTMQQAKHIGKIVLVHPHQHELTILAKASYLITGGLGGLGLTVAHWLATQGARHLILLGRSQPSPAAQEQIRQLAAQGVIITIAQADVSDPAQVQRVVSQIPAAYPLRGVIHAAGVLADGALPHQEWRRFDQVLAPKVQGTWHLHEATKALPLDFFVLFSSLASLFGNRGQANHAAANAFLDAFAHYRRSQGLPALSINWGAWAEVGAAAELVRNHHTQLAAQGLGPIAPDQGVAALATLLRASATQVAVSPINWQTRLQNQPARRAFEQAFWQTTPAPQVHQTDNIAALRDQLAKADAAERRTLIEQSFRTVAARVLAAPSPQSIDLRQGLVALGLDSLMAIELRNRLKQMLAVELPVTNFLDNASMHSLIDQLDTHYAAQAATATPAPPVATALDASPSGQSGATTKKIRRTL
jgi:myxalamid-type polyketide synthase MxaB